MTIYLILSIAITGMIMNRVRGGGLTVLSWNMNWTRRGVEKPTKSIGKIGNDLVFAWIFSLLLIDGFDRYFYLSFAILFFAMWIGRSFGWGTYIGGMIEKKVTYEEEIVWIDKLILNKSNYPVARNAIALSFRGLMWTVSLVAGFLLIDTFAEVPKQILYLTPVGFLMGLCYYLTIKFADRHEFIIRGKGWSLGEYLWGFVLWGCCGYLIVG